MNAAYANFAGLDLLASAVLLIDDGLLVRYINPAGENLLAVSARAVTGHTAGEIKYKRADASTPHMGLTTWAGKQVCKADVCVAKNYLAEQELGNLRNLVNMYLDHAGDQAKRHTHMRMADWKTKLDEFLQFYGRKVLTGKGLISADRAKAKAERQYKLFDERRRAEKARLVGETRPKPKRLGRGK